MIPLEMLFLQKWIKLIIFVEIFVVKRTYNIYKNIPLGLIIKKDLKMVGMSQKELAATIGMSYKLLNHSINKKRFFSKDECERLDKFFNYEENFCWNIQLNARQRLHEATTLSQMDTPPLIRACVFWDIDVAKLDWTTHRQFILKRVQAYGNSSEIESIHKYYSKYPH